MKTLTSILAALSLLSTAKAVTNDCYVWQWYNDDLQSIIDNSKEGDVVRILRGDYSIARFDVNVTQNVTIISQDVTVRGTFTLSDNVNATFAGMNSAYFGITATGNSSLTVRNCNFSWTADTTLPYVSFNSTGALKVDNNYFSMIEGGGSVIAIQDYSKADITKNIMYWQLNAITVLPINQKATSILNILNNTIDNGYGTAMVINDTAAIVKILNNSISNTPLDIEKPIGATNITYKANNFYNEVQPLTLAQTGLMQLIGDDENFSFFPDYLDRYGGYQLSTNSALWFRGQYIEGDTPYFPDSQRTWVGANGEGMPVVPEPKTWALVAMALILLYAVNHRTK